MKRILIVNNNMYIGGVQRSLLNLLNEMHSKYDITLLLFYPHGELLNSVPHDVRIIYPRSPIKYWGMSRMHCSNIFCRFSRAFWAGMTRIFGIRTSFELASIFQKKLNGFDAAISFLHSGSPHVFYGGCNEFVLRCVDAKKKISFLHCDYGKINADCEYNKRLYHAFDSIAACSEGCKREFLKIIPELENNVSVVHNFQNYRQIREASAAASVSLPNGTLNILTVARFGKEKGILRAIEAVGHLGKAAGAICYNIIGAGAEYDEAVKMVKDLNLSGTVHLLGEISNPYGYMRASDLLLIPSISEAAPMVIGEAACLGLPVLSTETSSAEEMVNATGYGWVCANSVDGLCNGLKMTISDPEALSRRRDALRTMTFDNLTAEKEFSELMD